MGLMGNWFGGKKDDDKKKSGRRTRRSGRRSDSSKRAMPRPESKRPGSTIRQPHDPPAPPPTPSGGGVLTQGGGVQSPSNRKSSARRRRTSMKTKQIGQLLLKAQAITPEQLDRAISIQQEEGGLLGQILVRIEACNKGDIGAVIKKQRTITTIMLGDVEFGADAIALLTREFCERNRLVPFEKIGSILCVAMANVLDTQAKNDIKEMTQLQPKTYDATWQDIKAAIDRYYGPPPSYDNDPAPSGSSEDELIIELPDEPERNLQRDAHSLSEEAEGDLIEDLEALGIEEVYSGETVYAASPMAHRAAGLEDFDTDAAEEIEEFDALEGIVEVAPPAIDFAAEEVDAADEVEEYIPEAADLGILEVTEVEPVQTPTPEEKAPKGPALPARVMAAIPASLGYFTEVVQWGRANAERRWLAEHLADNVLPARPALGLRPA